MRLAKRHNLVGWLLLTWMVLFLLLVIPLHKRGAVRFVQADDSGQTVSVAYCPLCVGWGENGNDDPERRDNDRRDRGACAICQLRGMLVAPEAPKLELVVCGRLPAEASISAQSVAVPLVLVAAQGRAPPALG
ncbi:MAG: hypothetical protein AAGB34_01550 [Planctomycetota bacterium]